MLLHYTQVVATVGALALQCFLSRVENLEQWLNKCHVFLLVHHSIVSLVQDVQLSYFLQRLEIAVILTFKRLRFLHRHTLQMTTG